MADKKISQLPAATTPLAGTEVLPIVQSSTTDQVSVANLTAGRAVSAASLTLTSSPLPVASGGTNQTAFTAPSGNVKGLVYFDGTKLANDTTVTDVGYDTSTNTVTTNNLSYSGTLTGSTGVMNIGSGQLYKDTSGNFGIGVTPKAWTDFKVLQTGGGAFAGLSPQGAGVFSNVYYDGNYRYSTSSIAATYYITGSGAHTWFTAPSGTAGNAISFTQAMTLDASSNLTVNAGNLVIGTSGKGIDFSATPQPAGMTSELLADYEEGTWTPFIDSSTAGTGRACSGTGRYVKVGNTVFLSCLVSLDTVGTGGSGNLVVTGLPYNTVSDASLYWSGSVGNCSGLASPLTIVGTYMRGSINRFTLVGSNGSSNNPLLTTLAFSTYAAAGLTLILSISYQVS